MLCVDFWGPDFGVPIMYRTGSVIILAFALSAAGYAQSPEKFSQPADSEVEPAEQNSLTRSAPYPFEIKVNECFRRTDSQWGNGESCHSYIFEYCRESGSGNSYLENLRCLNFGTEYWQGRVDQAVADLVVLFDKHDSARAGASRRSSQITDLQEKWTVWRDAKCNFERVKHHRRTGLRMNDVAGCFFVMTSDHARDLELTLGIPNTPLNDVQRTALLLQVAFFERCHCGVIASFDSFVIGLPISQLDIFELWKNQDIDQFTPRIRVHANRRRAH